MLTLLLHLVDSNLAAPSIREVFLRVPSLFNLLDLALTLGVIFVLWRHRRHIFAGAEVTPRQYERLTGRLDAFERSLLESKTHTDARFDEFELVMQNRAKEDWDFRREIIDSEDKQLQRLDSVKAHIEGLVRRMDYNNRMLEQVQCVRENGIVSGCVKDPEDDRK